MPTPTPPTGPCRCGQPLALIGVNMKEGPPVALTFCPQCDWPKCGRCHQPMNPIRYKDHVCG